MTITIDDDSVLELCDRMLREGIDPQQALIAGLEANAINGRVFFKSHKDEAKKNLNEVGA